jgi:hypothetical protein
MEMHVPVGIEKLGRKVDINLESPQMKHPTKKKKDRSAWSTAD